MNIKKFMSDTVLKAEESDTIEPYFYVSTHEAIKQWREDHHELGVNQQITRGILVSEAFLLEHTEDFDDELTRLEDDLHTRLSEYYGNSFPEYLRKIKKSDRDRYDLDEYAQRVNCRSDERTDNQILTRIPTSIKEQMSVKRGMKGYIREAVRGMYVSAYGSRLDRIDCTRELLAYAEYGTDPEHDVAVAIIEGESDEYTLPGDKDISELTELITGTREWYEEPDITFSDIKYYQDTNLYLKSSQWEPERFETFYRAYENHDERLTESQCKRKFKSVWDIGEATISKWWPEFKDQYNIEFGSVETVEMDDIEDVGMGQLPQYPDADRELQSKLLSSAFAHKLEDGEDKIAVSLALKLVNLAGWGEDGDMDEQELIEYINKLDGDYNIEPFVRYSSKKFIIYEDWMTKLNRINMTKKMSETFIQRGLGEPESWLSDEEGEYLTDEVETILYDAYGLSDHNRVGVANEIEKDYL